MTRPDGTPTPSYNYPPASILATPGGSVGTHSRRYAVMDARRLISASRSTLTQTRAGDVGLSRASAAVFSEQRLHSASRSVASSLHFPGR